MIIKFAPRAYRDIGAIADYVKQHSPRGAASVMGRIDRTIQLIAKYQGAGRRIQNRAGVRVLPIGKYPDLVYYKAFSDHVLILHVRHAARRSPRVTDLIGD
jgi:plasmid stabilization system protein ParE